MLPIKAKHALHALKAPLLFIMLLKAVVDSNSPSTLSKTLSFEPAKQQHSDCRGTFISLIAQLTPNLLL